VAKPDREEEFANLLETMKRAAAALRDAGIPHALAGGLAVWARGGPQTEHDVDFLVKPADAERAQAALAEARMRPVKPPEPWLLKAYDGDVMIDLIFAPSGGPVDDAWLGRAEEIEVAAMRMPVASLEDVLVTKLLSLSEQEPDYSAALEISRSVREQIKWDEVRERSDSSPLARAFFTLVEGLEIAPPPER
jgi:putative nucleotidyltransferase-like protein